MVIIYELFSRRVISPIQSILSEAQASFSKEGEVLAKGHSMTRLKLGPDSRFYVAATIIKSSDLIGYIIGKIRFFEDLRGD